MYVDLAIFAQWLKTVHLLKCTTCISVGNKIATARIMVHVYELIEPLTLTVPHTTISVSSLPAANGILNMQNVKKLYLPIEHFILFYCSPISIQNVEQNFV